MHRIIFNTVYVPFPLFFSPSAKVVSRISRYLDDRYQTLGRDIYPLYALFTVRVRARQTRSGFRESARLIRSRRRASFLKYARSDYTRLRQKRIRRLLISSPVINVALSDDIPPVSFAR